MKQCDEEVIVHEETVGKKQGSGRQHGLGYCSTGIGQEMDEQHGWSENLLCLKTRQVQLQEFEKAGCQLTMKLIC